MTRLDHGPSGAGLACSSDDTVHHLSLLEYDDPWVYCRGHDGAFESMVGAGLAMVPDDIAFKVGKVKFSLRGICSCLHWMCIGMFALHDRLRVWKEAFQMAAAAQVC